MRMKFHFRTYQVSHKFQEKDSGYYSWKLGKRKVKTLFRNCSRRLARSLSTIRASRARAVEEIFMRKMTKN